MFDMTITRGEWDAFVCEYLSNLRVQRATVRSDIDRAQIKDSFVDHTDKVSIKYVLTDGSVVKEEDIEKHIAFEMTDGSVIRHTIPNNFEPGYMRQYGVDLSEDGELYFLHDWYARGGLSCFEVDTGKLRWRVKVKHARQAYVDGDHILCDFADNGVLKISVQTGEIVGRLPYGEANLLRLNKDSYLVGPKGRVFQIINDALEELYRIPYKTLKPFRYGAIIFSGDLTDDRLTIHGTEETEEEHALFWSYMKMKESGVVDEAVMERISELADAEGVDVEHYNFCHRFSRTIDISRYAINGRRRE